LALFGASHGAYSGTQHLLLADEIVTEHAWTRRGAHAGLTNYATLAYPIFCAANRHRPE